MCKVLLIKSLSSPLGLDDDLSFDPSLSSQIHPHEHIQAIHTKPKGRALWIYHILDMNHAYKVTNKHENNTLQSKLLTVCTQISVLDIHRIYHILFYQKSFSTHTHTQFYIYIFIFIIYYIFNRFFCLFWWGFLGTCIAPLEWMPFTSVFCLFLFLFLTSSLKSSLLHLLSHRNNIKTVNMINKSNIFIWRLNYLYTYGYNEKFHRSKYYQSL